MKTYLTTHETSGALAGKWKPPQAKEGHRGMAPRGGLWQSQFWHARGWEKVLCMNRLSPAGGRQTFLLELKPEPQTAPLVGTRGGPRQVLFPGTGDEVIFQTRIPERERGQGKGSSRQRSRMSTWREATGQGRRKGSIASSGTFHLLYALLCS